MTFERTTDLGLVRRIMTHPRIWSAIQDDYAPARDEWKPAEHPGIGYVLVKDGEEILGLFMFVAHSRVLWEIHTCLLPNAWGNRAKTASEGIAHWIWSNTGCERVITTVASSNRLALRFAKAGGLAEFGVNPNSFMKHGRLDDLILLGISRPDAYKRQSEVA